MLDFDLFRWKILGTKRDSNLGTLAFLATLVTNYTNGISLVIKLTLLVRGNQVLSNSTFRRPTV
jgi:hypothetical protein